MKEKELEFDNKINEVLSGVLDNVEPAEQAGLSEDTVNINLEASDEKPPLEEIPKPQEEEEPINAAELFKDKYYQEKKKRKAILADRQKLEQENQELKQYLNGTISVNSELYEKDIQNDIDKLTKIINDAIEGGHQDVFVQANLLLNKALIKQSEFERSANSRLRHNKNESPAAVEQSTNVHNEPSQSYIEQQEQIKLNRAEEWLEDRPELIKGSSKYNPQIQKELNDFIKDLDRELKKTGREDEILSDAYFDVLDEFVDSIKIKKPKEGYTSSNVGGVRNNFSNQGSNKIRITLSDFDKQMARELKMSEEQYLKYQYKNRA
jgi:hypothetical protein